MRLYKKLENRRGDVLKWGDEVEYNLVKVDKENSRAQLLLNAKPMLDFLHKQVWSILFCWLFTIKDQCEKLHFQQRHNQGLR